MKQTITIKGVDVKLLEKQRITLGEVLCPDRMWARDGGSIILNSKEVEALAGIINMLDAWSDEIYHNEENSMLPFSCKFCHRPVDPTKAHLHDGEYVGECCWDERLRATE